MDPKLHWQVCYNSLTPISSDTIWAFVIEWTIFRFAVAAAASAAHQPPIKDDRRDVDDSALKANASPLTEVNDAYEATTFVVTHANPIIIQLPTAAPTTTTASVLTVKEKITLLTKMQVCV